MTIKPDGHYQALYLQQEGKCMWCKQALPANLLYRDHVLPRSKGHPIMGYMENNTRKLANVVLACKTCNSIKSNLNLDEFEVAVRKRLGKSNFLAGEAMLESITRAKQQRLEELHSEMLETARKWKEGCKQRVKERRKAKAKTKREQKRIERQNLRLQKKKLAETTP